MRISVYAIITIIVLCIVLYTAETPHTCTTTGVHTVRTAPGRGMVHCALKEVAQDRSSAAHICTFATHASPNAPPRRRLGRVTAGPCDTPPLHMRDTPSLHTWRATRRHGRHCTRLTTLRCSLSIGTIDAVVALATDAAHPPSLPPRHTPRATLCCRRNAKGGVCRP